jgi:hypothetical protein
MNLEQIQNAVQALYKEADVPPPTPAYPIAPLGPLTETLHLRSIERSGLTLRNAENYLVEMSAMRAKGRAGDEPTDTKLAGFLYADSRLAALFVEREDPVTRRRFSAAHEIGHLFLHFRPYLKARREAFERGEILELPGGCTDAFGAGSAKAAEGEDGGNGGAGGDEVILLVSEEEEREANAFAAELLMPALVIRELAAFWARHLPAHSLAERLAMETLVSRQAMRLRLAALGL